MKDDLFLASPEEPVQGFAVDMADVPLESGDVATSGNVMWRMLVDGDRTPSDALTAGVAEFGAFDALLPHRHKQSELCYGLEGSGTMTIDGVPHLMKPGVALFIPGNAEHGTVAGAKGLRFLYVFPESRFSDVQYRFSAA